VNRKTSTPTPPDVRSGKARTPLSGRIIRLSPFSRYGAAVALAGAAVIIRLALDPLWDVKLPYITLFPAIMLSAWMGGVGPGIVTTALTALAAEYFWVEPTGSWVVHDKTELVGLGLLAAIGVFISILNEAWRRGIDAVTASEERLRVTVQSLGDAVIATDDHGRVTQLNPVAEHLTGWAHDDAIGRRLDEVLVIVNEENRQPAANPVERVLREGTIAGLTNHTLLISRSGREIPIDDSAAPVRREDGTITGAVMVFRDISARRQVERERAERERVSRELAAIVESSEDAILGMRLDGTINAWNRAAERMYGYDATEAIGRSIRLVVPEHRVREEEDVLGRIRAGERVDHFETVRRRKDGTEFPVSLTISPVRDAAGAVVGASKIARDVTEQKRADERFRLAVEATRSRTEELERVLDVIPAAVWIAKDSECRQVVGNKSAAALFGLPPDTNFSQTPAPGADAPRIRHFRGARELLPSELPMQRAASTGVAQPVAEIEMYLPDGRRLTMIGGAVPLLDSVGRVRGVVSAFSDISARKEIDEQRAELLSREQAARADLERAGRLKDEFLAVLSHELRTPLNAVLGYAQLLGSGALSPQRTAHALEAIQRNAQAQARLVESLLDLSRILAGKLELDFAKIDLSKVIDAAVDVVRPEVDAKQITLDVDMPRGGVALVGDANRLQQVFWNLLANAVKFTPQHGRIQIHVYRGDSQAEVKITDSGQGISPEFLPYVFDRFRQEDHSQKSPSGLGLGLALVREMVHAHRGIVLAQSDGGGRGSTFVVTLPLTLPLSTRAHLVNGGDDEEKLVSLAGLKILVVDDDSDVRELLTLVLESRGAAVRTVSTTSEAMNSVNSDRPHVLLADLRMPREDGYALIRKLRAQERQRDDPRLPAVAVTAYASGTDREKVIAAGYDWHVAKPIDADSLARTVVRLTRVQNV
jgi:PAS domain S-box-containing protein